MRTQSEIQKQLSEMAEKEYKAFSQKLIPGVENYLGVRLPQLRKMAKELAKEDWKACLGWTEFHYFEEIMLQGMVLGYAKADIEELLSYVKQFIPRITNWSVNDSFCAGFHIAEKEREAVWNFLIPYHDSTKEFEVRVVAIMLMDHFLIEEYRDRVFSVLGKLCVSEYYASMAVAWAFATAWAKFPEETRQYIAKHPLEKITYLRMLQKGVESRRITAQDKEWMKAERQRVRSLLS